MRFLKKQVLFISKKGVFLNLQIRFNLCFGFFQLKPMSKVNFFFEKTIFFFAIAE